MNKKARKVLLFVLLIFGLLTMVGFTINWYLTQRLEAYLNEQLSESVSDATGGFYTFSFDNLSIGLFSGELSLHNIEIVPDTLAFNEWAAKDSLPNTYFKIHVKSINFKGVNLTWRINYKKLNFNLFEIESPDVKIFEAYSSDNFEQKVNYMDSKTLYELVSSYFDVISVKKMDMNNASVTYVIEDPIAPSIYALNGINFNAYRFLLDENSYKNGKLLYFDDFEFSVEKPQVILNTSQLLLTADTILLNTIDSIIQIKNVRLEPRDTLWHKIHQTPETYIDAQVKAVEVKGAKFRRVEGVNYFDARSFDIISSDIKYFAAKQDTVAPPKQENDTILQSLSLNRIISPLLRSVAIKNIGIENAKFEYTQTSGEYKNVYTLEQLDFHAGNFLIDSLADVKNRYWHSENFSLDAKGINSSIADKNHNMSIARISLNAMSGFLHIEDIKVWPISTLSKQDYVSGSIPLVALEGLNIDKGIEADVLKINSPRIKYFRVSAPKKEVSVDNSTANQNNVFDLISPFLNFFSIKRISMQNGYLAYNDKNTNTNYTLNSLNVFATDFLINDDTRKVSPYLFQYGGFGLSFRNFDNYLPGKDYRLRIAKGGFSTMGDGLRLQDVKLIPQEQVKNKRSGTYFNLEIPLIESKEGIYDPKAKSIDVVSLNVHSPKVDIIRLGAEFKKSGTSASEDISSILKVLNIAALDVKNAHLNYLDKSSNDTLSIKMNDLLLNTVSWNVGAKSRIEEVVLKTPQVSFSKHYTDKKAVINKKDEFALGFADLLGDTISIGTFNMLDLDFNILQPDVLLGVHAKQLSIDQIRWSTKGNNSSFALNTFSIKSPKVNYHELYENRKTNVQFADSLYKKDIYDIVGSYAKHFSVNKFEIIDASLNYTSDLDVMNVNLRKVNETNFSIDGLSLNVNKKATVVDNITFNTSNIRFPIMDGFYTIEVGKIDLNTKKDSLVFQQLYMIPAYPKAEFAYKQPNHKDWFNISVGNVLFLGIDIPKYFADKELYIKHLQIDDVVLENFKNQQIEIQHNIMPMLYENLQKAPLKLSVDNLDVNNMSVVYEELPKNGTESGKIFFTEMNGKFTGFTNIASHPRQFIKLNADGKFMGTGYFTATWLLPVSYYNDEFILKAHLRQFDLRDLNQLITPLAVAGVTSGTLKDMKFETVASSKGAKVEMKFLYNDLNVTVFKNLETKSTQKLYTYLANKAIKTNNPDKEGGKPRVAHNTIERDPYHSTFNYIWQILQPPVVESVGISQGKQNFLKKTAKVFSDIKNFFSFGKKKKAQPETDKEQKED